MMHVRNSVLAFPGRAAYNENNKNGEALSLRVNRTVLTL